VFAMASWFMVGHSNGDLVDVQVELHSLVSAPSIRSVY
jgi:hypothetical protein